MHEYISRACSFKKNLQTNLSRDPHPQRVSKKKDTSSDNKHLKKKWQKPYTKFWPKHDRKNKQTKNDTNSEEPPAAPTLLL